MSEVEIVLKHGGGTYVNEGCRLCCTGFEKNTVESIFTFAQE